MADDTGVGFVHHLPPFIAALPCRSFLSMSRMSDLGKGSCSPTQMAVDFERGDSSIHFSVIAGVILAASGWPAATTETPPTDNQQWVTMDSMAWRLCRGLLPGRLVCRTTRSGKEDSASVAMTQRNSVRKSLATRTNDGRSAFSRNAPVVA